MSLGNFIVPEIGIPDGKYTAQLNHIEYILNDKYGNYYIVNWNVMRPYDFQGKKHQVRFNVEHPNDTVRHIAIDQFAIFCRDVGGLSKGDQIEEENFLFKIADLMIRNRIGKNDGRRYVDIVSYELVSHVSIDNETPKETAQTILNDHTINGIAGSGMQPLPTTALPSDALNDQVPF